MSIPPYIFHSRLLSLIYIETVQKKAWAMKKQVSLTLAALNGLNLRTFNQGFLPSYLLNSFQSRECRWLLFLAVPWKPKPKPSIRCVVRKFYLCRSSEGNSCVCPLVFFLFPFLVGKLSTPLPLPDFSPGFRGSSIMHTIKGNTEAK